jgi:hypothetical protein
LESVFQSCGIGKIFPRFLRTARGRRGDFGAFLPGFSEKRRFLFLEKGKGVRGVEMKILWGLSILLLAMGFRLHVDLSRIAGRPRREKRGGKEVTIPCPNGFCGEAAAFCWRSVCRDARPSASVEQTHAHYGNKETEQKVQALSKRVEALENRQAGVLTPPHNKPFFQPGRQVGSQARKNDQGG